MFEKIIAFSVREKLTVFIGVAVIIAAGIYSLRQLPVDAVPDITNNQVQVVTTSPSLAAEDVERFITAPIEISLANLPDISEIRSISRFGLSIVTVVFDEHIPVLQSRQLVSEQLLIASQNIPAGFGAPEMMPITTGLGEIYQYVLEVDPDYGHLYDLAELRSINDWQVKRQLAGIEGVIEISSFGGFVKQYEVAFNPDRLNSFGISLEELIAALESNNANAGGGNISRGKEAVYIRSNGLLRSVEEIGRIPIAQRGQMPITVADVAEVRFGHAIRYGALTKDGKGEVVGGITLMLKGANARSTVERIRTRIEEVQKSLPPGVSIEPYLDRSELVGRSIGTAVRNLAEGGIVVALILIFFLGNFRAGLLVASVIPLSMLFALTMMHIFGVSANLMSLGAIDFGIVVDGAVIIVEGILHFMAAHAVGKSLNQDKMDHLVTVSAGAIYRSAAFGVLIILVVFLPILQLGGVEGKMFQPMALTLMFALGGGMILSLTYVPAVAALALKGYNHEKQTLGVRIMEKLRSGYTNILTRAIPYRKTALGIALLALGFTLWRASHMGSVFLPDLEEGDLAMQMAVPAGSNLEETVALATAVEKTLIENFPEVRDVVSKIGTAEIPTDPMAIEDADIMILLKPKSEWVSAADRTELTDLMKEALSIYPEISFEFTQPIQLRFNELLSGTKADIAVKIFGPDHEMLHLLGTQAEQIIDGLPGAADVKLERTEGLRQLVLKMDRDKMAWHGISVDEANTALQTAFAGTKTGMVFEGERRFDLVLRLHPDLRHNADLTALYVHNSMGKAIPLSEVATFVPSEGMSMVSRENTRRRITVGVNVRDRSLTEVVEDIRLALEEKLTLPAGYTVSYEGEFRNFQEARQRLLIAVPVSLVIIISLLYLAYHKWRFAMLIFTLVPFTAIGGIWMLTLRDMPFSISAGVGFIALFGVGVLNGIVLVSHINMLRKEHPSMDLYTVVIKGASERFRPVLLTAMVATFGFLPMAISSTAGAEVQRPLASVVLGGLVINTILTLLLLPILYVWMERRKPGFKAKTALTILILTGVFSSGYSQTTSWPAFREMALADNPLLESEQLAVEMAKKRKGEAWNISPTEIDYQYGQINRSDISNDYQWNVTQRFGSIPQHINRSKALESEITVSESELALYRTDFEAGLMSAYHRWVVAKVRVDFAESRSLRLDSLLIAVQKQAEYGAITANERYLIESAVLNFRKLHTEALLQYSISRQDLESISQLDISTLNPTEDELFGATLSMPDSMNTYLRYKAEEQRIEAARQSLKAQEAAFFPALSAGYQNARLEGFSGGQSWLVGLAFPIWYAPDKSRLRQAAVDVEIKSAGLRAEQFRAESALRQAMEAYNASAIRFEKDAAIFRESATMLGKTATAAYRAGETDAYQLIQSITTATDLYMSYLDLSESYGLSKINLYRFVNR
jgi:cobalt-zinc-cadmium resistance protein CzcA